MQMVTKFSHSKSRIVVSIHFFSFSYHFCWQRLATKEFSARRERWIVWRRIWRNGRENWKEFTNALLELVESLMRSTWSQSSSSIRSFFHFICYRDAFSHSLWPYAQWTCIFVNKNDEGRDDEQLATRKIKRAFSVAPKRKKKVLTGEVKLFVIFRSVHCTMESFVIFSMKSYEAKEEKFSIFLFSFLLHIRFVPTKETKRWQRNNWEKTSQTRKCIATVSK